MKRRTLLACATGSLAAMAGCASRTDPTRTPAGNGTRTDEPATTATPATETPFSVDLRRVEYVAHAYQPSSSRGIDPDDIVPEEDVPDALLEALYEARDGDYVAESVSEELLAGIDKFRKYATGVLAPYVELEGIPYAFDPTVPTFVAELEEDILDDYDEDRLFPDDEYRELESEAVREFVRALTTQGTHVPRSAYRRSVVPDAVSAFLEEYDYIEDPRGVSKINTTIRHEDPPYTITMQELTPQDKWGRPVVEEADLDETLVAFFERVLDSEHRKPAMPAPNRWRRFTDEVPDAYGAFVEDYQATPYVRLDGTVYRIGVGQPVYERLPVSVTIEDVDPASRAFTLSVSPAPEKPADEVEGPFTFSSRGALPSALWVIRDGEHYRLDEPDNPLRAREADNEVLETVDAGETISASYTVPGHLPPGRYVSRGMFRLSWNVPGQTPGDAGAYPFELLLTVEDG